LQAAQKMQAAAGGKGRGVNGMPTQAQIQAMQRAMPPGMMQQLRSGGGIQEMMKAMMGGGQMGDAEMAEMQRMMGSMGGGMGRGGMPDIGALMRSMGGGL